MRTLVSLAVALILATSVLATPVSAEIDPAQWTSVLPVQNRNNSLLSGAAAIPANLNEVAFRMDVPASGVGNPFILITQQVNGTIELSYDGGNTFPDVQTVPFFGSVTWNGTTGGWGRSGGPPIMATQFSPDRYPTHVKVGYTVVSGPVSFGASYQAD